MATKKISELTTTTTPSSSALFPIVQDGTTLAVTLANVAANMPTISVANLTADTLTVTNNATVGGTLGITGTSTLSNDVTFTGAAYNVLWDKSDNSLEFADNAKAVFGAGPDLSIYHDGSNSVIAETGTGGLAILSSVVQIENAAANETMATFTQNGAVSLRHDNTEKFVTTSAGATVSGTLTATAFTGNLTGNVTGNTSGSAGSCTGNSATATTSTNVTVADESTDTTCFPLFVTAATGNLPPKSGSNLAFNSGTGALTATSFVGNLTGNVTGNTSGSSGSTTGNAATATALATGREISLAGDVTASGVSFDGTGNISLSTTIAANSVALSTDTTGNYIAAVSGTTNEISVSGSGSEGATATIGLPDDVTIAGNLTVNGTTTSVDTTNLEVEDPLIKLAKNNSAADSLDIGFYGLYDTSGSQDLYSGLFRDANDSGKYKLFKDLQVEPTTTVNTSGTGYATGTLVATFEGNITGNVTGNTSGSSGSCTGNAAGLSSTLAVGSGGTGATSLTANGALIGNGTGAVTAVDMSTKGKLLAGDGSGNPSTLSVGTNTHVLTADSSEATGLKWAAAAAAGATGAGGDEVFVENERVVTTNYTLSSNKSAMCVGPLTINTGVTVTIPSGERLVIL